MTRCALDRYESAPSRLCEQLANSSARQVPRCDVAEIGGYPACRLPRANYFNQVAQVFVAPLLRTPTTASQTFPRTDSAPLGEVATPLAERLGLDRHFERGHVRLPEEIRRDGIGFDDDLGDTRGALTVPSNVGPEPSPLDEPLVRVVAAEDPADLTPVCRDRIHRTHVRIPGGRDTRQVRSPPQHVRMLRVMNRDEKAQAETAVVDIETAGRILGIGRGLAYRLARSGELPTLQLGRRLVVPRVQLDRMLAGRAEREREVV